MVTTSFIQRGKTLKHTRMFADLFQKKIGAFSALFPRHPRFHFIERHFRVMGSTAINRVPFPTSLVHVSSPP
jgi:hypothetical protein